MTMALPRDLHAVPWRTGRKVGRTIYAVTGSNPEEHPLIGVMDTPALARAAVEAHNERLERPA